MSMYKIYALLDPRTNEVCYIGKTSNKRVEDRLRSHLYEARKKGSKNKRCAWIKGLLNENLKPEIKVIEEVDSLEKANQKEIYYISVFKIFNSRLKNDQPGGDGQPKGYKFKNRYSSPKGKKVAAFEEYRKSKKHIGFKFTKEHKKKLSEAHKGPRPNRRKIIIIEDTLGKITYKLKGYKAVQDFLGISKSVLAHYLHGSYKHLYKDRFRICKN